MCQFLENYWKKLPPVIKMGLLQGSVGKQHCLGLASTLLSKIHTPASQQEELTLARQLLIAAWEHSPLNGELANNILKLCQGHISQEFQTVLQCVARTWQAPPNLNSLNSLLQKGNFKQSLGYLSQKRQADPGNLFWVEQTWNLCFFNNSLELATNLLAELNHELEPLKYYLAAVCALAKHANALQKKDWDAAEQCLCAANSHLKKTIQQIPLNPQAATFAWLAPLELLGQTLILQNQGDSQIGNQVGRQVSQADEAVSIWQQILKIRPWHTSLALQLYSQLEHKPHSSAPDGSISLLLYSFNKAKDLDAAIAAFAPEAGLFSGIHIINNGSEDETAQMLKAWQERLGKERLEIISLPVNVGAAAARNWLRDLPAVANSDFCIYLDDDALVDFASQPASSINQAVNSSEQNPKLKPSSWLSHFASSLAAYPQASAYGLKIIDHHTPYLAQSVDLHVTPPSFSQLGSCQKNNPEATLEHWANLLTAPSEQNSPPEIKLDFSLNRVHSQSFGLANLAEETPDFGSFSYIRPCLSVTGCCHLFRTKNLLEQGGFNLSFSPSQFDDLERDLRQASQGRYACYNGMGQVSHLQRTGKGLGRAKQMSPAQYGSALANRFKLSAHFTDSKLLGLLRFQFELLENDLLQKFSKLAAL